MVGCSGGDVRCGVFVVGWGGFGVWCGGLGCGVVVVVLSTSSVTLWLKESLKASVTTVGKEKPSCRPRPRKGKELPEV